MPKGVALLWRAFLVGQSTLETLHKMQIDPDWVPPAVWFTKTHLFLALFLWWQAFVLTKAPAAGAWNRYKIWLGRCFGTQGTRPNDDPWYQNQCLHPEEHQKQLKRIQKMTLSCLLQKVRKRSFKSYGVVLKLRWPNFEVFWPPTYLWLIFLSNR